jgi:hypothetical protein
MNAVNTWSVTLTPDMVTMLDIGGAQTWSGSVSASPWYGMVRIVISSVRGEAVVNSSSEWKGWCVAEVALALLMLVMGGQILRGRLEFAFAARPTSITGSAPN